MRFLFYHCVLIIRSLHFQNYYRVITQLLINGPTIIQTFFVISGYMLATQFMELRANAAFSMRYLVQAVVYRYLRYVYSCRQCICQNLFTNKYCSHPA